MNQYPIAVIVGSLRKDSFNNKLAAALAKLAPAEFSLKPVRIDDLPLYNQDDDGKPAAQVPRLKREITAARLAPSARHWHSSTCATFSPILTCPLWASPRCFSRRRTGCSTRTAASVRTAAISCRTG